MGKTIFIELVHTLNQYLANGLSQKVVHDQYEGSAHLLELVKENKLPLSARAGAAAMSRLYKNLFRQYDKGHLQENIHSPVEMSQIWTAGFLSEVDKRLNSFLCKNAEFIPLIDERARQYLGLQKEGSFDVVGEKMTLDSARALFMHTDSHYGVFELHNLAQRAQSAGLPHLTSIFEKSNGALFAGLNVLARNGYATNGSFYKGLIDSPESEYLITRIKSSGRILLTQINSCGNKEYHFGMKREYRVVLIMQGRGVNVSKWGANGVSEEYIEFILPSDHYDFVSETQEEIQEDNGLPFPTVKDCLTIKQLTSSKKSLF